MGLLRGLWERWWTCSPEIIQEPPKASLAYLTIPSPDHLLLNLQFEGRFVRVEISKNQLAGIVVQGARELLSTGGGR